MPQKVSDVLQVRAFCQQVGGAGMAETLGSVMLRLNSQRDHSPSNEARDCVGAHRTKWLAPSHKHFGALALRPRIIDITTNRFPDLWLYWKLLQAAPLRAAHGKAVPLPINIR